MSMTDAVRAAMVAAMKAGEKESKEALSMLLAALKLKEIDKREPLTAEEETAVVIREIKQTQETMDTAPADRTELIEKCKARITVYLDFAPKQLSTDEVKEIIAAVMLELGLENPTPADKGTIMQKLMPLTKGKADGKLVNQLVSSLLSKNVLVGARGMKKDWFFVKDNTICNFRTTGVLLRGDKILVQRDRGGTEYALPGGHVTIGETAETALIREYKEETGADILCERLVWVEETFWQWNGKNTHGIAFYFLISLKNNSDIPDGYFSSQKDICNVVLEWVTIEQLKDMTIYPRFLIDKIGCIADGIEHFISIE